MLVIKGQSRMYRAALFLFLFLIIASATTAQNQAAQEGGVLRAQRQPAHYRYVDGIAEPDPAVTPGVVRTASAKEICSKDFRTAPFRIATKSRSTLKRICAKYGVSNCPKLNKMELDDLLPVELGGANVEANVWVQLAPEYHWKDILENHLKHAVCIDNSLGLPEAQKCIVSDWVACYKQQIGPLPKE